MLATKGKAGNELVRNEVREVGLRTPMLAKVVGSLDFGCNLPREVVDPARNVAQDGACNVELHGLRIRMACGPYCDLDASLFARRGAPALPHDTYRLTDKLRRDAIHQDDSVGDPTCQLQHLWTRRRNIDWHRRSQMAELGCLAFGERDHLAGKQLTAERYGIRQNWHLSSLEIH